MRALYVSGCASILHHEHAACSPQRCQVTVPSLCSHSVLFPPASRPIQELLSLPLQPLTSILFISQIPSKLHPGHSTRRLFLLSLLQSSLYVVEGVLVFSHCPEPDWAPPRAARLLHLIHLFTAGGFFFLSLLLFFRATASLSREALMAYIWRSVLIFYLSWQGCNCGAVSCREFHQCCCCRSFGFIPKGQSVKCFAYFKKVSLSFLLFAFMHYLFFLSILFSLLFFSFVAPHWC